MILIANIVITKAYAHRINRGDIALEEVKVEVPSNIYEEIIR